MGEEGRLRDQPRRNRFFRIPPLPSRAVPGRLTLVAGTAGLGSTW